MHFGADELSKATRSLFGGAVAHLAAAVIADIPPAGIIAPEDKDIWFSVWHCASYKILAFFSVFLL